jgi:dTDP-4-dehydrorhamnose reductase
MTALNILQFGRTGQLARELLARAPGSNVRIEALGRDALDLADAADVDRVLREAKVDLVINAAAYTAVDRAESDEPGARRGNVDGPRALAIAADTAGVPLVHFSTDYVFDGTKVGAYVEGDPIAPLGVYGRTKAEGEKAVRNAGEKHVIVRTSWVYGAYGNNFLKTMLRLAADRDELRVVADQHGCPTATIDLAEAVFAIDRALVAGATPWGVYHFAGTGVTTWRDFACAIADEQARFTGRRPPVHAITTSEYPTPAKRPANSELNSALFGKTFGYTAAPWRDRAMQVVEALMAKAGHTDNTGSTSRSRFQTEKLT